jgi:type VII secretion-associated serine protease mycosin
MLGRKRMVARKPAALLAALALLLPAALIAAPSTPALADQVRQAQMWVLGMLNAQQAWSVSQGAGVTVAVIDSGVNKNVSDLAGSVTEGPDLTGVNTSPNNPDWGQHGTWMASLIAGHGHDGGGDGILGTAPRAKILSIRVITDPNDPNYHKYQRESSARSQQDLAKAITDAVRDGAGVISMSIGYGGPSLPVRQALQDAYDHNVIVLASSGNSGKASRPRAPYSFPADYPGVIGVAAVGQNGAPASFSSDNLSVQVAAPGVNVPAQGRDGQYWLVSGTSPACALTAGVAALIRSAYPELPASEVAEALTTTTQNRPPGGYNDDVGFGTVDAAAALTAARKLNAEPATQAGLATSGHFGGGHAAVPAAPVFKRGPGLLIVFAVLVVVSLALVSVALSGLVVLRRRLRPPAGAG